MYDGFLGLLQAMVHIRTDGTVLDIYMVHVPLLCVMLDILSCVLDSVNGFLLLGNEYAHLQGLLSRDGIALKSYSRH